MDALMPLASLPTQISGRNRVWRRVIIDAIRADPDWRNGNYASQPPSLRTAIEMLHFMSSNPPLRQQQMPTLAKSDSALDSAVESSMKTSDANDTLYQFEASRDYDPGPDLEKIRARIAASIACHAAIKVNMPLEQNKMEWLLAELAKTDHPYTCPHGRPVVLRYSMKDIQKAFKRI